VATNVHLTPELEGFAREQVGSGRYNNVSEVVRSALRLMQDRANRRASFDAMIDAATAEADRDGWASADTALAEVDAVIKAGTVGRGA
jgi:antitoxin ParD1/3/4